MRAQLSADHFISSPLNNSKLLISHLPGVQAVIRPRSCLFKNSKGMNDLGRHGLNTFPDAEVFVAALRLRPPVAVSGDFNVTHRVMFNSEFHVFVLN